MDIQGKVGPQAQLVGGKQDVRLEGTGAAVVTEFHGRYREAAFRQALFSGGNLAGVASTAGFATTYTGICLSNPIGSGKNLSLLKLGITPLVAQTTALLCGLMTGYNGGTNVTHTTPLVTANNFLGGPTGVGLIDSAATLPTAPVRAQVLGSLTTGAVTVQMQAGAVWDLEGSYEIPPGGYIALWTSIASVAASLAASMMWEEASTTG